MYIINKCGLDERVVSIQCVYMHGLFPGNVQYGHQWVKIQLVGRKRTYKPPRTAVTRVDCAST